MRYPQGATVTLSFTVRDATGALVDASPISLAVRKPDGTATAGSPYTPAHDGTGLYHQDLPLADIATVGHYQHVLAATISGNAGVQVGEFDVYDPFEPAVVSLADAKAYLNITGTASDDELQAFIDKAEAAIAQRIGPLTIATCTSRVRGWACVLRLPVFPVVALTSVTPVGGAPLDVTQLVASPDALRVVEWLNGGYFGDRWYDVVYTAGHAANPDLQQALLELLRHLWATQRGTGGRGPTQPDRTPGLAYTFPDRVNELLAPYLPPGIA